MGKNMLDILLEELINESFPELKKVRIYSIYRKRANHPYDDSLLLTVRSTPNPKAEPKYNIYTGYEMINSTREQKKGGIAHELGHVILDIKDYILDTWGKADKTTASVRDEFGLLCERSADMQAVRRGCIVDLIEFRLMILNRYKLKNQEGLRLSELYHLLLKVEMKYSKARYMPLNLWFNLYQQYRHKHGLPPSGSR